MNKQVHELILKANARKKSHEAEFKIWSNHTFNRGLYRGKISECDFFINQLADLLFSEGATEGGDKDGKAESSTMA